jgi:hypothetical protein
MRITRAEAEEMIRRGLLSPDALTNSTPKGNSQPPQQSPDPSKTCSTDSKRKSKAKPKVKGRGENKLEREARLELESDSNLVVEREKIKIRIGPEGNKCWYTPDLLVYDKLSKKFALCEVKGPYEREDARVKRMACADWCKRVNIGFILAKKRKNERKIDWEWITHP